jgi:hypothetical protein
VWIIRYRSSGADIRNAPLADANSEPWQPVTKRHRREPPIRTVCLSEEAELVRQLPKKTIHLNAKEIVALFCKSLILLNT